MPFVCIHVFAWAGVGGILVHVPGPSGASTQAQVLPRAQEVAPRPGVGGWRCLFAAACVVLEREERLVCGSSTEGRAARCGSTEGRD